MMMLYPIPQQMTQGKASWNYATRRWVILPEEASFRLSLPPAVEDRLRELAAASEGEASQAAARARPQSSQTVSVHIVDARRGERSVRARSFTPPHEGWGLGGGIVSTATPMAAAARLLARGEVVARGALPPEQCLDPAAMFAELETRGVRFEMHETQEVT